MSNGGLDGENEYNIEFSGYTPELDSQAEFATPEFVKRLLILGTLDIGSEGR